MCVFSSGLSSVDQMHLLAVADTLSHFSSDVMDKLTQANAGSILILLFDSVDQLRWHVEIYTMVC